MKTSRVFISLALCVLFIAAVGCSKNDEVDPNAMGGETNLELTKVGGEFGVYVETGASIPGLNNLKDSVMITKNENGIVTFHGIFSFDTTFTNGLAEALGVSELPGDVRQAVIDTYVKRYSATLDTTDKNAMSLTADIKVKMTSEGIQEYLSSKGDLSKPATIVKYSASVGDKYEFTNSDGIKVTRTVAYKSATDDYDIAFWRIKVIKVEETKDDPITEKITYITNHKYGLVAVIIKAKTGKELTLGIYPPTL